MTYSFPFQSSSHQLSLKKICQKINVNRIPLINIRKKNPSFPNKNKFPKNATQKYVSLSHPLLPNSISIVDGCEMKWASCQKEWRNPVTEKRASKLYNFVKHMSNGRQEFVSVSNWHTCWLWEIRMWQTTKDKLRGRRKTLQKQHMEILLF